MRHFREVVIFRLVILSCFATLIIFLVKTARPPFTSNTVTPLVRKYNILWPPAYGQQERHTTEHKTTQKTPTTVDDKQQVGARLRSLAPEIFEKVPPTFLPEYRSPCWQEDERLNCLPYFYQIGSYKCATSDLWDKLVQHPNVAPVAKEPHWWAWRRFGYTKLPCDVKMVLRTRDITGRGNDSSFDWYLNWFRLQTNSSIHKNNQLVFGDASITGLWGTADGKANYTDPEPEFVLADIIHGVQPDAKIYAILRDPVERAMSEYLYAHKNVKTTPEEFHTVVERSLNATSQCLETRKSPKACAFSLQIGNWEEFVPIHGAYYLYLREWIEAYGRDKVHVIKTEDWIDKPQEVLLKLLAFLELDPLPEGQLSKILQRKVKNSRKSRKPQFQAMHNSTRKLLEAFYHPWNRALADLLGDTNFLWGAE